MDAILAAMLDYQELEIKLKPREVHDFSYNIYFYCLKKLKKHVFSLKNGLTTRYL